MTSEIQLVNILKEKGMTISTAESITAGMIGSTIVKVPGASAVFKEGFITYTNESKVNRLGVPQELIDQKGVICPDTARLMAEGCAKAADTDIAISTTGNAGPDVMEFKPVGRVYIAVCINGETTVSEHTYSGERESIRRQTTNAAIRECLNRLAKQ
ncbi:MAG: CinA family protein [Eubacteriales bacterium]|nr:CinA family protein [Eubacteriales bacterium]